MKDSRRLMRGAAWWTALVVAVLVPFFLYEREVRSFLDTALAVADGNRILIAFVLFALLASDVFLPVPSCLAGALCGALLGPWIGFAVSFAAMTAGAALGYAVGCGFGSLARRLTGDSHDILDAASPVWGPRLLLLLRPVPVLAECSTVYAGIRRWPLASCAMWASVGNAAISAVYAVLGHWGRTDDSPLGAFAAVIALSAISFLAGWLMRDRTARK